MSSGVTLIRSRRSFLAASKLIVGAGVSLALAGRSALAQQGDGNGERQPVFLSLGRRRSWRSRVDYVATLGSSKRAAAGDAGDRVSEWQDGGLRCLSMLVSLRRALT